jgi:hypothetical protein
MEEKAEWQKPELVELVRGRPGEAVLGFCKTMAEGGPFGQCESVGACASVVAS